MVVHVDNHIHQKTVSIVFLLVYVLAIIGTGNCVTEANMEAHITSCTSEGADIVKGSLMPSLCDVQSLIE